MQIAIDVRILQTPARHRGIATYVRELVAALSRLKSGHDFQLLVTRGEPLPSLDLAAQCNYGWLAVPAPIRPRHLNWIWDSFFLPGRLARQGVELFHHTTPFEFLFGYDPTRRAPFPVVTTVYDLIPYHQPRETFRNRPPLLRPAYFHLAKTLAASGLVLAISDFTARDIRSSLGIGPERIRVTPLAVAAKYRPADEASRARVAARYNLGEPFLFYLGGFDANKNLARLLRALNVVIKLNPNCRLALAGRIDDPVRRGLLAELEPDNRDKVMFLGLVEDQDLPALYSLCRAFVFPSLWEGFGLPPLEAMACGAPVACSTATSLPEVTGEAALGFDPQNEPEMAQVLGRLWGEEDLRRKLSAASLERAAQFSWDRCAQQTLEAYEEALR